MVKKRILEVLKNASTREALDAINLVPERQVDCSFC